MEEEHRTDKIQEMEERMGFQRNTWKAERLAWFFMGLVGLSALLGVFGNGPLSRAEVSSPGIPVVATYDWIQRRSASTVIELTYSEQATAGGAVEATVSLAMLEAFSIEEIRPEPLVSEADSHGVLWRFKTVPGQSGSILLRISPVEVGLHKLQIAMGNSQLVLPIFVLP